MTSSNEESKALVLGAPLRCARASSREEAVCFQSRERIAEAMLSHGFAGNLLPLRSFRRAAGLFLAACVLFLLTPERSWAADDFNNTVHRIEARYHVHRNYGFLMGLAGAMVHCSAPFTGVSGFKMAFFENQHLLDSDESIAEVIQAGDKSGWLPLLRSYSAHSSERVYVYAQNGDNDIKLFIVSVDANDTVVMQMKINPNKLSAFIGRYERD